VAYKVFGQQSIQIIFESNCPADSFVELAGQTADYSRPTCELKHTASPGTKKSAKFAVEGDISGSPPALPFAVAFHRKLAF